MKSVFSKKKSQVHLQRNAFDLSHSDIFSIAPGMLLPIHVSEVNPNEHLVITPANYVRTMPLTSAAFTRLKPHIEFFFVPMRVLSRQFQQFVVGTKYPVSALDTLNDYNNHLPSIALSAIRYWLITEASKVDGLGIPLSTGSKRLLDLLG